MTITMHSTDQIVEVQGGIRARVWQGKTASGIEVQVLVTRIALHKDSDCSQFERELEETPAPKAAGQGAFPLRMIL